MEVIMRTKTRIVAVLLLSVLLTPALSAQWEPPACPWLCYNHGPDWTECMERLYFSGDMFDCREVCIWWPATMCWCQGDGCIEV